MPKISNPLLGEAFYRIENKARAKSALLEPHLLTIKRSERDPVSFWSTIQESGQLLLVGLSFISVGALVRKIRTSIIAYRASLSSRQHPESPSS